MKDPENELNVHRISGAPEEWIADFLRQGLAKYGGRIYGAAVHLEVHSEDDPESSYCLFFFNWPSTAQMQGRLSTSVTNLALRHLGVQVP